MWKYVSRRIRDVCDKTYNVLDVRRPWQRGSERFCAENNLAGDQCQEESSRGQNDNIKVICYTLLNVAQRKPSGVNDGWKHRDNTGSNSSENDGFRRKEYCSFQHSWIGAITWTSAIICGWYTSQLICLYRRNHKWEGPRCLPYLISSTHRIPQDFHSLQFQKCFPFSAPPSPPIESHHEHSEKHKQQKRSFFECPFFTGKAANQLSTFDFDKFASEQNKIVFPVNNEASKNDTKHRRADLSTAKDEEEQPPYPTVETAMQNLISVIGEIEFQLGVQNLEIGDYPTAVSHLKLGTSHQHAGAAFNLGICYEQGFGVKKNARVAMECFYTAATLGHAQAMYNLGVYYARGLGGLRRSRTMARKYFAAAADLGLEEALAALGPAYKPQRRDSMQAGPSTGSSPVGAPFEFHFNYNDLAQFGFGEMKSADQLDQIELRMVSAMA